MTHSQKLTPEMCSQLLDQCVMQIWNWIRRVLFWGASAICLRVITTSANNDRFTSTYHIITII